MSCVFCEIANKDTKNQILYKYKKDDINGICDVIVFEPLNPFSKRAFIICTRYPYRQFFR